jgi:hypothetical protein
MVRSVFDELTTPESPWASPGALDGSGFDLGSPGGGNPDCGPGGMPGGFDAFSGAGEDSASMMGGLNEMLGGMLDGAADMLGGLGDMMGDMFGGMGDMLGDMGDMLGDMKDGFGSMFGSDSGTESPSGLDNSTGRTDFGSSPITAGDSPFSSGTLGDKGSDNSPFGRMFDSGKSTGMDPFKESRTGGSSPGGDKGMAKSTPWEKPVADKPGSKQGTGPSDIAVTPAMRKLADASYDQAAKMGTVGYCARGVRRAVKDAFSKDVQVPSAYQMPKRLMESGKFKALGPDVSKETLRNTPGLVVVYPPYTRKGRYHPHGHVEVTQGNGMASCDHNARLYRPTRPLGVYQPV